jgi:hypothetical protein
MSEPTTPTTGTEAVWELLEDLETEAEIARLVAHPEEIDALLREHGVDRAHVDAVFAKALGVTLAPRPAPKTERSNVIHVGFFGRLGTPRASFLAAAASIFLIVATGEVRWFGRIQPGGLPSDLQLSYQPPPPSAKWLAAVGDAYRRGAEQACAKQQWDRCKKGLEQAKQYDPAGDARPDVQQLWALDENGILESQKNSMNAKGGH